MDPKQRLIDHIRERSQPMEPLATGEEARLEPMPELRVVVFDIYGTLFISGSGDISLAKAEDRSPAIRAALETAGFEITDPGAPFAKGFLEFVEKFRDERRAQAITYPEVRIPEVWDAFLEDARRRNWITGEGDLELAIVDHECRVNPCWPMPGLEPALARLTNKGVPLGIVSNAQFYTPLLFPALLDRAIDTYSFGERYCVWSYVEREGKPSPDLYRRLREKLEADGYESRELLYIGNDRRNDIWPAALAGFRTALFAGDARSLRWRQDDPDCGDVRPDCLLTNLEQIFEILP